MKQFARCTSCRQWYARRAITTVEIVQANGLQRTTLWCVRCIRDAEHRSQSFEDVPDRQEVTSSVAVAIHTHESAHQMGSTGMALS